VGGLREIVVEGTTGRLLPAGDVDSLTAAIREALADRQALSTMGAHGRRRYEVEYSQEAMTRRWQDAYAALLERRGHPPRSRP
jgi:glycosyltransferase involved in cell wall biosynthesis